MDEREAEQILRRVYSLLSESEYAWILDQIEGAATAGTDPEREVSTYTAELDLILANLRWVVEHEDRMEASIELHLLRPHDLREVSWRDPRPEPRPLFSEVVHLRRERRPALLEAIDELEAML